MIRRSFTAAIAATIVLGGTFAPTALAGKKQSYYMSKKTIYFDGKLVSQPMGLVAKDVNTHRPTTYIPIWYVLDALKAAGVEYTWNGRDLNIVPAKGMVLNLSNLHPGNEDTRIYINGTLVDTTYRIVAKDPYSHADTTYIPIWYVQYVLQHLGVSSSWGGNSWRMSVTPNRPVVQKLSISAAAGAVGTGQPDQLTVTAGYSNGSTAVVSGSDIKWTTNDSANAFITPSQVFLATKPGTYTITASYGGVTQSIQIQVYGNTASIQLKADGSLVANGVSTQKVAVTAVDTAGITAQNENGTVQITADQPWLVLGNVNGKNILGRSALVQLRNGTGTVDVQAPTSPGVSIHLAARGLSDIQSGVSVQYGTVTMTSTPQTAASLAITPENGQKYLVANQGGNTAAFNVTVNDQTGQLMRYGTFAYNIAVSGSAIYNGGSTGVYVGGGTSRIVIQSEQGVAGPVTVTVSAPGLAAASATIQAVIAQQATQFVAVQSGSGSGFVEGGSASYVLTPEDAHGVPTTFPTGQFVVYVTNSQGQPATNIRMNGVTETPYGVALGNHQSVTLYDDTRGAHAGVYTVTIVDATGRKWGEFQVNESPGETKKLTLSSADSEVSVASPTTRLHLQYSDAYGNPTVGPAGTAQVVLTASGGQGGSTINGQDATKGVALTTDSSGGTSATFSAQPYAGGVWRIVGRDGKLTSNTISVAVMNTLASQATVALKDVTTGSTTQATAGDTLQVSLGALDTYNNPYFGSDTFAVTFPSGALNGVKSTATSGGVTTVTGTLAQLNADFSHVQVAKAQTLTVQMTDTSIHNAQPGAAGISVLPGPFHGFAVFNTQNQPITSDNPLQVATNQPVEVWVRPIDAFGNLVPISPASYIVDLAANTGNGSFRLSPTGSDIRQLVFPIGAPTEAVYYVTSAGSYVLSASISTVDPSHSAVSVHNFTAYKSKPSTNGSGLLSVVLKDKWGYPISGHGAQLSSSASAKGITVGGFTESTSSPGTYTAQITSTENHSAVSITVKDGGATVGTSNRFNS